MKIFEWKPKKIRVYVTMYHEIQISKGTLRAIPALLLSILKAILSNLYDVWKYHFRRQTILFS